MSRLVSVLYSEFHPFHHLERFETFKKVVSRDPDDLQKGDVIIIHGGADISPSLYKKAVSQRTYADDRPSKRDEIEWAMMRRAKELDIPIIGICRGAQMLCALAGGFLIQDVQNHHGSHTVTTDEGTVIRVNSIHHQMLYPFDVKHEMLAEVKPKLSGYHLDVDTNIEMPTEPEFVYFPQLKGFAIQWHPEMMSADCDATKFVFKKMEERL